MQNNLRLYNIADADYTNIIKDNIREEISTKIETFGQ